MTALPHMQSSAGRKPVMLLVLGPHRSGTSLTTRALECLGAVNSKNSIPANEFNPTGYFEDSEVNHFNESVLLPALAKTWHSIGPIDWSKLNTGESARLREKASGIIRDNYGSEHSLRVLKEPRLARLLPFWRPLLEQAGFECKLVLPIRDPLSVARSLSVRDGFSINHGAMLYLRNWMDILTDGAELPFSFIFFREMLESPGRALHGVAGDLGLPLPADFDDRVRSFAENHLDSTVRRRDASEEDIAHESEIPSLVRGFYSHLVAAAANRDMKHLLMEVQSVADELAPLDNTLRDYDLHAIEKQAALDEQAARMTREIQAALSEKADRMTRESQAALAERATVAVVLQKRMDDLLNSTSWRITAPLRGFRTLCRRVRTSCREILERS